MVPIPFAANPVTLPLVKEAVHAKVVNAVAEVGTYPTAVLLQIEVVAELLTIGFG
jgi:hypothetical protein